MIRQRRVNGSAVAFMMILRPLPLPSPPAFCLPLSASRPVTPGRGGVGDVPAGEPLRQPARPGQLPQRLIDGGLQIPVGLADRGADREAVGGIAVVEPELPPP